MIRGRLAKEQADGRRPRGPDELIGVGLVDQKLSEEEADDEISGVWLSFLTSHVEDERR